MSKSNKVLVIIFTLLFVVLIFEVYYIMSSKNSKTTSASANPTQVLTVTPSKAPTPTIDYSYTPPSKLAPSSDWFSQEHLDYYRQLIVDGTITSSILQTQYTGTMKNINFSSAKNDRGTEFSIYNFNLIGKDGQSKFLFSFAAPIYKNIEVVKTVNDTEVPINLTDLKDGDKINMKYSINLSVDSMDPDYVKQIKIIKL